MLKSAPQERVIHNNALRNLLLIISVGGLLAVLVKTGGMIETGDWTGVSGLLVVVPLLGLTLSLTRMKIIIDCNGLTYITPISREFVNFSDIIQIQTKLYSGGRGGALQIYYGPSRQAGKPLEISLSLFRAADLGRLINSVQVANASVSVDGYAQGLTKTTGQQKDLSKTLWWYLVAIVVFCLIRSHFDLIRSHWLN